MSHVLLHLTEAGLSMTFPTDLDTANELFDDCVENMKDDRAEDDEILHLFELPTLAFNEPIKVDHNGQLSGVTPIRSHVPYKWAHNDEEG